MAVNPGNKQKRERTIFGLFAEAARLPVKSGSIQSQAPPAPDILCEIQGKGPVAFELVEIVTPALAKEMKDGQKLKKAFKTTCAVYPPTAAKFSDALIYVGYLNKTTIKQRVSVVPEVVDELCQQNESWDGNISIPIKLRNVVSEISYPKFQCLAVCLTAQSSML